MRLALNQIGQVVDAEFADDPVYKCIVCEESVFAKNIKRIDRKRKYHFAHYGDDCNVGGLETYLHRIAKNVLKDADRLMLLDTNMVLYQNPSVEKGYGGFRPDVTIEIDGKTTAIEILVTHPTEAGKIDAFSKNGISIYEIDLGGMDYYSPLPEIEEAVLRTPGNRKLLGQLTNINAPAEDSTPINNGSQEKTRSISFQDIVLTTMFFAIGNWIWRKFKNSRNSSPSRTNKRRRKVYK